jgi:hypothetical protein
MAFGRAYGFDTLSLTAESGWGATTSASNTVAVTSDAARTGDGGVRITRGDAAGLVYFGVGNSSQPPTLLNSQMWYGIAIRFQTLPSSDTVVLRVGAGTGVSGYILVNSSGQLTCQIQGGTASSTVATLTTGVWYWLEILHDVSTTTHSIKARINQGTDQTATRSGQSATTSRINVLGTDVAGGGTYICDYDDLVIHTSQTTFESNSRKVIRLRPNSDVNSVWLITGGDGVNRWNSVDDLTPDDGSSLISSTTANAVQLLGMETYTLASGETFEGLSTYGRVGSTGTTGTRTVAANLRSGATDGSGSTWSALINGYQNNTVARDDANVPGGTGWSQSDVDGIVLRLLKDSTTSNVLVTAVWIYAAVVEFPTVEKSSSDSGAGSESSSLQRQSSQTDSGTGTDTSSLQRQSTQTDSGTGTEGSSSITTTLSHSDSGTGTDSSSLQRQSSQTDSGAGTESSAIATTLTRTDSGTGTETNAISAILTRTDSGSGSETNTISSALATSDSGVGSQNNSISVTTANSDSGIGTDDKSLSASISRTDSGAGSETQSISSGVSSTDIGSSVESASILVTLTNSDSGTGSENQSIHPTELISSSDSGTSSSEIHSISSQLASSDDGAGSEDVALAISITGDSGVGSEGTPSINVAATSSDEGQIAETNAIISLLENQEDSGAGSDLASVLFSSIVTDSASGIETTFIESDVSYSDEGSSTEETALVVSLADTDNGVAIDLGNANTDDEKSSSDIATGIDNAAIEVFDLAQFSPRIPAQVNDTLTISVYLPGEMTLGVTTSITVEAGESSEGFPSNSDEGQSTEAAFIVVMLADEDAGVIFETPDVSAKTSSFDLGGSLEDYLVFGTVLGIDAGTGTDIQAISFGPQEGENLVYSVIGGEFVLVTPRRKIAGVFR